MKLHHLPPTLQNAILQGAMRVLSESDDMDRMLQKADLLLTHDFPSVHAGEESVEDLEERLERAKWIKEFRMHMEEFWIKTSYPKKYWLNTINGELSSWVSDEEWKTVSPSDAAKSNISYWEN